MLYTIVEKSGSSGSAQDMLLAVGDAMRAGWQPIGGIAMTRDEDGYTVYAQAMERVETASGTPSGIAYEMTDEQWHSVQEKTDTDIMSIVMGVVSGTVTVGDGAGAIAEHCAACFLEGVKSGGDG